MENILEQLFKDKVGEYVKEKQQSIKSYEDFKKDFYFLEGYGFHIKNCKNIIVIENHNKYTFIKPIGKQKYIIGTYLIGISPDGLKSIDNILKSIYWADKECTSDQLAIFFANIWIENDKKQ